MLAQALGAVPIQEIAEKDSRICWFLELFLGPAKNTTCTPLAVGCRRSWLKTLR